MKRILDKLFLTDRGENEGKPPSKLRYFVFLGLLGILMVILSNIFSDKDPEEAEMKIETGKTQQTQEANKAQPEVNPEIEQIARSYEEDLVKMLNNIQGVSEAEIMVNLESSDVKVYERNLISGGQTTNEEDQSGGTRQVEDKTEETQVVLVRQGDTEMPILVQTNRPEVRGVFIVAKGAEQAQIKSWIIEAISSVLDVSSHRISVMPKE